MKQSVVGRLTAALLLLTLCFSMSLMLASCTASSNRVRFEVKDYGEFVVELYPDIAPITVENFKSLVSQGFYDGLTFHRVVKDFMIQGGCPDGNGGGSSANNIKGEFLANGINNRLSHTEGVISMARSKNYNSASCQFFIVTETSKQNSQSLDGKYAAFGKVVEGIEVVKAIAACNVIYNEEGEKSKPAIEIKITRVYFE